MMFNGKCGINVTNAKKENATFLHFDSFACNQYLGGIKREFYMGFVIQLVY